MKRINLVLAFAMLPFVISAQDFFKSADAFFNKNVNGNRVNYTAIQKDPNALNELMELVKNYDVKSVDKQEAKAFYINAYNIAVIKQVIDNLPTKSVMDVPGFFIGTKFVIGGKKMTLDHLENGLLRKDFSDPRLHFVLVCGAKGCPPIINKAYLPATLDDQLNMQTKNAMNNPEFIRINTTDQKAEISEIFNWYKEDFKTSPSILEYINSYRAQKIPDEYKVSYYTYDWSLNNAVANETGEPFDIGEGGELNLQSYTPSVLLTNGQWELKSFQNIYTQTGGYDTAHQFTDFGSRSNFFASINQFTYGINERVNVGVDLWVKSVLYNKKEESPLQTLRFEDGPNSRTTLSLMGPKLRVSPFKSIDHFSINSSFLIPVAADQNGSEDPSKPWLAPDAYLWVTQFYYDQAIGNSFQIFFQLAPWYTIQKKNEAAQNKVDLPVDIFFSYFPTKKITLYVQQEFWPTFDVEGDLASYFMQGGVGGKYQLIPGFLELEASYTNFYFGKSAGAGQTFNLGFRIIHR